MNVAVIELHFLPSLEYFNAIRSFDKVFIESFESFQKQSFRNRCYILMANKTGRLTVPVLKKGKKGSIKDIKIDYDQKWQANHWRAITSAYRNAPFFEFYADYFHQILFKNLTFLFDLNITLLELCLKQLNINTNIFFTDRYDKNISPEITDLRSKIHPKTHYSNNEFYTPYSYTQVFGSSFTENLSIIDLLFCEGPQSSLILKNSSHI